MGTARYDHYEPRVGGFRAKLAAAWAVGLVGEVWGVGLNSSGKIVAGAGQTGIVGVLVINNDWPAGETVDVMTSGQIVDVAYLNDGTTPTTAGTNYFVDSVTGDLLTADGGGDTPIGFLVEKDGRDRLIVRVGGVGSAATPSGLSLNELSDVTLTTPANTQVLKYNGTTWVNAADAT